MSLLDRRPGRAETPPGAPSSGRDRRPRTWLWIAAVAVLALIGAGLVVWGQAGDDPSPPTPPPSAGPSGGASTGPTQPPASTAPAQSADQIAVAGATAGYRQYLAVLNAMFASGGKTTAKLPTVASGDALKIAQSSANTYRREGLRDIGRGAVLWTRPTSIGVPGADGAVKDVTLSSCYDPGSTQTLDRSGKPLPSEGNPTDRLLETIEMAKVGTNWTVANHSNRIVKTC